MKNTLAIGAILIGGILVYAGFKNWTLADTVRFFSGQEMLGEVPGVKTGTAVPDGGLTIQEMPAPAPGYEWTGKKRSDSGQWGYVQVPINPNDPATPAFPDNDPRNEPGSTANTMPPAEQKPA